MGIKFSEVQSTAESLLETNEKNKSNVQKCQSNLNNCIFQVNRNKAAYNNAQMAYYQAVQAKERRQRELQNQAENGESVERLDSSYDREIERAQREVEISRATLESSVMIERQATADLQTAQSQLESSRDELKNINYEIQNVIDNYRITESQAYELSSLPYGTNIHSFLAKLSAKKQIATELMNKVLRSLGIDGVTYFDERQPSGNNGGAFVKTMHQRGRSLSYGGGEYDAVGSSETVGAYSMGNSSGTSEYAPTQQLTPKQQLTNYMNAHNYSMDDYATYSQDPEWQRLHRLAYTDFYVRQRENAEISPSRKRIDVKNGSNYGDYHTIVPSPTNDRYFVASYHYKEHLDTLINPDSYKYIPYERNEQIVKTVNANEIEGVYLYKNDLNTGRFWQMHKSDGTESSFLEIASHIPEVQRRLENGANLGELKNDSILGATASIYFDESHPEFPTVIENDGYYTFQTSGRHRIMSAQALGYDIPVRIIGKCTKNNN